MKIEWLRGKVQMPINLKKHGIAMNTCIYDKNRLNDLFYST